MVGMDGGLQRRFFKAKDISDLFTLTDDAAATNETADLFAEVRHCGSPNMPV
jgi:hypothetical protein